MTPTVSRWPTPATLLAAALTVGCVACGNGGGNSRPTDSQTGPQDGPITGPPTVTVTFLPPVGSFDDLRGRVTGVVTSDHRVAVYINVGGWWNKPTWAAPLTPIGANGQWTCDITTGGQDQLATHVAAFLVPRGTTVPQLAGEANLPASLWEQAVAHYIVLRVAPGVRTIDFGGYTWWVKTSAEPVGPGGNYFSDSEEHVRVDAQGRLHLRIARTNGRWTCAEVVCTRSLGHGTYRFDVATDATTINERAVLGLFTWDDQPADHHREIDVELSRWSDPANDNAQYVVQPFDREGNLHRFNLPAGLGATSHRFNWARGRVEFRSTAGATSLESWTYTGPDVPRPGAENPRLNLWLQNGFGSPPSDGRPVEVVIESFTYER